MPKLFKIDYHVNSAWPHAMDYDGHKYVLAIDEREARDKVFNNVCEKGIAANDIAVKEVQEIRNILC